MPTYEYRCQACEHEFEEFQSITASPLKKCPKCGKLRLKRLIGTGAGIIFKGSGFYETDYRSESYKSAAKADSTASSSSSTADTSKTTSKADAKTAPASDAKAAGASAGSETKNISSKSDSKPASSSSSGNSSKNKK